MIPLLLLLFTATSVYCQAITNMNHIAAFVSMHNRLRRSVIPRATNLNHVFWSSELANASNAAACGYPTTPLIEHATRGRNYFRDTSRENNSARVTPIIISAVSKWFMDKGDYIYENNTCPLATKETCDAFRLIISPVLSKIGCAVKKDCNTTRSTGYHQYLCLYDTRVTASSAPIYKAGVLGSDCAGTGNATEASGFSHAGLCLRTAANAWNFYTTISPRFYQDQFYIRCLITCKNCATDQSKEETRTGICKCKTCLSGYSGADCSIKGNNTAALVCGPCQQQGTICQNKGVNKKVDGKCICDCGTTGWAGPECNIRKDAYNSAVYLELSNSLSNDPLPVDPFLASQISRLFLEPALRTAINASCLKNNINVAKCCNETQPKAAPSSPISNTASAVIDSGFTPNGRDYWLAISVYWFAKNSMCEENTKKDVIYAPSELLVDILKDSHFGTAITSELSKLSGFDGYRHDTIKLVGDSIKSYKDFADDKYVIKTLDSITTTAIANPGTTTAAAGADTTTPGVILVMVLVLLLTTARILTPVL